MDNQLSQFIATKEKTHTQHYGAHSGSRSGLSDYNDGGNEDSYSIQNEYEKDFDGKIAYGNDNEIEILVSITVDFSRETNNIQDSTSFRQ